jgi:hypothetical protein
MVAYVRVHARQMATYYFSGRLILVISYSEAVGFRIGFSW